MRLNRGNLVGLGVNPRNHLGLGDVLERGKRLRVRRPKLYLNGQGKRAGGHNIVRAGNRAVDFLNHIGQVALRSHAAGFNLGRVNRRHWSVGKGWVSVQRGIRNLIAISIGSYAKVGRVKGAKPLLALNRVAD